MGCDQAPVTDQLQCVSGMKSKLLGLALKDPEAAACSQVLGRAHIFLPLGFGMRLPLIGMPLPISSQSFIIHLNSASE